MNRSRIPGLALAALLLAATGVAAQPDDEQGAAPAATETPEKTGPGDSATTTDAAAGKSAGATRSPSDYRSSEQISEDLPVSFPVDI
jgi:hypothetical protein